MDQSRRRVWLLGVGAFAVVVTIAVAAYLITKDDGTSTQRAAPTTTTVAPSTTTTAVGPSTTPATVPVDTSSAVWPDVSSSTRYSDPTAAARGFATDFVGFTDPVVGAFQAGDARSGEVTVQAKTAGPMTTVFVRQLGDSWWVLGSSTANIQLSSPSALSAVTSPLHLQGSSTAFEATVNTAVREDGSTEPIATGIVMGGANGTMGQFDGTLGFTAPSSGTWGAVVLLTRSAENGNVVEATVVRVKFA
jgi:hypothetical protein